MQELEVNIDITTVSFVVNYKNLLQTGKQICSYLLLHYVIIIA